jgi:dUTP pyrophosphatase
MSIAFVKTDPYAVVPTVAHGTDSGFDLTATRLVRKGPGNVEVYGTGIRARPPEGFWFLLAPRSSISKTGYILANSVGVIDEGYRGEILVALRRVDETQPTIELPCRIAQLIPMKRWEFPVRVLDSFEESTERGEGGFGSTNARSS